MHRTVLPSSDGPMLSVTAANATASSAVDQCMELEHVVGYAGHFPQTCMFHPKNKDVMVYSIGAVIVIGNRTDPHEQFFIRGHDAEISAMAISSDGKFIASGQLGSTVHAGSVAPVLVWSYKNLSNVYVFDSLKHGISSLKFSPDARFLAATSRDICIIWDLEVGEIVASKRMQKTINLLAWGKMTRDPRCSRATYQLNLACSSQVECNSLVYDVSAVRYVLKSELMTMPTGGLVRNYTSASVVAPNAGHFLLAGTGNGEICVFNTDHKIFRASLPVATNGVVSLLCRVSEEDDSSVVYVGAGDGSVKEMSGADCEWKIVRTAQVSGRVMSLSLRADGKSLLAGTSSGNMHEISLSDFSSTVIASSHVDGINAVSFIKSLRSDDVTRVKSSNDVPNDVCCTASNDGTVRLWSLSDYSAIARIQEDSDALCVCVAQRTDGFRVVLSGWNDKSIRAYDARDGCEGKPIFSIPDAHRTQIRCIDATDTFIVSGDVEGTVRVWTWGRELLCQFSEHRQAVTSVRADNRVPYRLHSCGEDGMVLTYDLRMERRVSSHHLRRRAFLAMSQREDSEQEILVTTKCGSILAWDRDEKAPVMSVHDAERPLRCASLSSSGRFLAVAGDDRLVKVYELVRQSGEALKTPRLIAVGSGHFSAVLDVSWSPDEKQIVSVAGNCSMCVWNFYGTTLIDGASG
eukprot:g1438.t1